MKIFLYEGHQIEILDGTNYITIDDAGFIEGHEEYPKYRIGKWYSSRIEEIGQVYFDEEELKDQLSKHKLSRLDHFNRAIIGIYENLHLLHALKIIELSPEVISDFEIF